MTAPILFIVSIIGLTTGYISAQPKPENTILTPYTSPVPSVQPSPTIEPSPIPTPTPSPTPKPKKIIKGYVSHYSVDGCLGCREDRLMRNGEKLDDTKATIAVNGLKMNTRVLVTNTDNGKSIEAKVTDTGGFGRHGRVADLTPVVYKYLETKTDKSVVLIEVID